MAVPHYYIKPGGQCTVNLSQFAAGYTKSPAFSIKNSTGLTISISGTSLTAKDMSNPTGIYYFDIVVADSEGASHEQRLGVYVGNADFTDVRNVNSGNTSFRVTPVVFDTHLDFSGISAESMPISVSVKDLMGRTVVSYDYALQAGQNDFQINGLNHLPAQMYLLQISEKATGKIIYINKVIKN